MARYGRDYGRGTWGRGTYDLDYNAGYPGLESERGGPWGRGWANYYTEGGYRRSLGREPGLRAGGVRVHGGYGRDYAMQGGGRRFDLGRRETYDYDVNAGGRLRRGWNELRRGGRYRYW